VQNLAAPIRSERRSEKSPKGDAVDIEDKVRDHYSGDDLEGRILDALTGAGIDLETLRPEQLAGLDQLHAGFAPATDHVLDLLHLAADTPLIDVGSGIGGCSRRAAGRGCVVTGVDLSADFVEVARSLTRRVGLMDRVTFENASATDLPHPDGSFARAMLVHAGMNIPDKARVFAEVRRVLRRDGLFALYEQMRIGDGELTFPMPWAEDESSSFVERRGRYAELLSDADFVVEHDEDRTAAVAALGPPAPGALTPAVLMGPRFEESIGNNISASASGTLAAVVMVARAV